MTRVANWLAGAFCSLILTAIVVAHDAGPKQCIHGECSGGAIVGSPVLDTQPKYASSKFPNLGRVADCPPGFTNNGLTCGRGADSMSAPSQVASCPAGYTNMGLTCFQGVDTYTKGCTTIFKKYPCREGYTDNGCFCGRGASSLGASAMSCPAGYFLNRSLGRCYKNCPEGYTNMGESCFQGVQTLGMSAMSCGPDETKDGPRCYPKQGVCPPDREYFLGLCYSKCPPGSTRTAISTCSHDVRWRGNTHAWVVNRALDLLQRSQDPTAVRTAATMNTPGCRVEWENGLWDTDDGDFADSPGKAMGTHFYNGAGKDAEGNAITTVTYMYFGTEQNSKGNARTNTKDLIDALTSLPFSTPEKADCYKIGRALHYLTDITQPMHATSFSGGSVPLMLHPVLEEYWGTIQARYPPIAAWDRRWDNLTPDALFHEAAVKSATLAPPLMRTLGYGGTLCTMTPESGITYTGYCFLGDPAVDNQLGAILRDGYQTTASFLYSVLKYSNLAQGQTATQSSTDLGGDPGRAVDGRTSGVWNDNSVTHTKEEEEPFWEVDLGAIRQIEGLLISNRTDACCINRLSNFRVFVSSTPFASRSVASTQADASVVTLSHPGAPAETVRMLFKSNYGETVPGRYVRVQLAGKGILSLAEVNVAGY